MATILQSDLLTNFLYPLLLMFFISFGLLEKIKIFGDDKTQLNAMVSLVIGLIFVGAVFPKLIVANLVQFMTIGLVVIFIGLMLWGFVSGKAEFGESFKKPAAWIIGIAVLFAVLWATGAGSPIVVGLQKFFGFLFTSSWSGSFWTNFIFILVIAVAIAVVLIKPKSE